MFIYIYIYIYGGSEARAGQRVGFGKGYTITILYYTILYYTILYYTILYYNV